MASNFRLRRFSNPATLKSIAPALLRQFLLPYVAVLAQRGLLLDETISIDYDTLAEILMSPDESMPDAMLDALFFVDEMSVPGNFDDLMQEATELGIDLAGQEPSAADLAVRLWLTDSNALERLHAERFLVKPKAFHSYHASSASLPALEQPSVALIEALQEELNDWFETHKRGRGTRVFVFLRDTRAWFLIRHGEPYKREGTLEGDESSSVYYRPEKFDVLTYNIEVGELAIHAGTKGQKEKYCQAIGKHLFGSETFFDVNATAGKFTLAPIVAEGAACLEVGELSDTIDTIRLVELHFRHDVQLYHVEVHKSDDVFTALKLIDRAIPDSAQLLKASFRVFFRNATRPRTVVVRPPSVTIFDRESDADVLERWMELRGFIKAEHANTQTILAVS